MISLLMMFLACGEKSEDTSLEEACECECAEQEEEVTEEEEVLEEDKLDEEKLEEELDALFEEETLEEMGR